MDWQDVFSFIIFLLLVAFSKRKKLADEDVTEPEASEIPEIDTVRKRIEALKRQRSEVLQKDVFPREDSVKERPIFSAYKHLPKEEVVKTSVVSEVVPMMPVEEKSKDVLKSIDLPQKKSKLRSWVVGQIVLGTPAYRRYGNFIHR